MPRRPRWSDAEFVAAVRASLSIAGTCRALGLVPIGGNYRTVNSALKRLAVDTSHWTGQAWNRGLRVSSPRRRLPLSELLRAGRPISSPTLRQRLIDEELLPRACACCGLTTWLGEVIPLEVDHVNGDAIDNRLENLRLLCPNCHARTATYRGRNKARLRRARTGATVT